MSEENRSNGVSLLDIFNILCRYKWLLLALPIVGAVLAALLVFVILRPTWEASAVLEVGHVGQIGQASQTLVEPPANVVARMMLPSYAKGALNYAGIKSDELKTMREYYGTLKVAQVKGAELIEVKLRGPSAEIANKLIQGAIVKLQKAHSEMMAASIEKNQKQLQMLTEDIHKTSVEADMLRQRLLASHNWSDFDATVATSLLQGKVTELREMIQKKLAVEEQLSPSRTYTTRVVDEIYVSEGAVSPNKLAIITIAILLGLFGSVVIAFAHNAITSKSA